MDGHHEPSLTTRIERLEQEVVRLREADRRAARNERIAATMLWVASVEVPSDMTVSVLMSTRDRAACVGRAIESVRAQSHGNWELVIVDHGSTDSTPQVLQAVDDPRVRSVRLERSTRRLDVNNRLLDLVRGEAVAYLDDDNAMHPDWLRAVVWALSTRPEVDVLYGAHVVEHGDLDDGHLLDFFPHVHLEPWNRELLEHRMITDSSAIAHRAGLEEARGGEDVRGYMDWDRLLRLTGTRPALALPAIAVLYGEGAQDRVSDVVDHQRERAIVAAGHGLPSAPAYEGGRLGLLRQVKELQLLLNERDAEIARLRGV